MLGFGGGENLAVLSSDGEVDEELPDLGGGPLGFGFGGGAADVFDGPSF